MTDSHHLSRKSLPKYHTLGHTSESDDMSNASSVKVPPFYGIIITTLVFVLSATFLLSDRMKPQAGCGEVAVYQTTSDGLHSLTKMSSNSISCSSSGSSPDQRLGSSSISPTTQIKIRKSRTRQSIIGFGGAFTEAASLTFASLSETVQQKIVEMYWGKDGAGYTLGRVPIGSCDFSVASYSFDDVAGDWDLDHFDMEVKHDQEAMIPFIKRAVATAAANGRPLKLFGSPWSPPAWLKAKVNGVQSMVGSAREGGLLDSDQARNTWANYLSKWISAYQFQGFDIWGLTVQNEPEFAAPWEACKYNASTEASFLREHLGPVMKEHHPEVKIMAFDHNKDHLEAWTSTMFAEDGSGANEYVDGMAFHWYAGGMDRLQDGIFGHHFVAKTHDILKETHNEEAVPFLLSTEASSCSGTASPGSSLSWIRSERYAHDILNDLANYANGWVDWNLLLDSEGGPNHLGNVCDAPVISTPDYSGVIVQPYLDTISHFSKYLVPGTVMVDVTIASVYYATHNTAESSPASQLSNEDEAAATQKYGGATRMPSGATLALWPCDGSSRQRLVLNPDNQKLVVENIQRMSDVGLDDGVEDAWLTLCVSNVNNAVGGNSAQVVDCDADEWVGRFSYSETERGHQLILLNPSRGSNGQTCLGASLRYTSVMQDQGGAPLSLAPCEGNEDHSLTQNWHWNEPMKSYEMIMPSQNNNPKSVSDTASCLTVGWPFVQAVAGVTPSDETVLVVVNEGVLPVSVSVSLGDESSVSIGGKLPPQSIQTYLIKT